MNATRTAAADARYEQARQRYFDAARELTDAVLDKVAEMVLAVFPRAATLHVLGEYGDEFRFIVRTQDVRGADGGIIAGWAEGAGGAEAVEAFEDLTDEIDPLLDWLGDLTGEDYLGAQTLELGR